MKTICNVWNANLDENKKRSERLVMPVLIYGKETLDFKAYDILEI